MYASQVLRDLREAIPYSKDLPERDARLSEVLKKVFPAGRDMLFDLLDLRFKHPKTYIFLKDHVQTQQENLHPGTLRENRTLF